MIQVNLKAIRFAAVVLLFFSTSFISHVVFFFSPWKRRKFQTTLNGFFSSRALDVLGISVEVRGAHRLPPDGVFIMVSNHMSYIDALILASCFPVIFITSVEVQQSPFIGKLCTFANTLFVERRRRMQLPEEFKKIQETLHHGLSLAFFPEGTSSNGETVLPFKSALFGSFKGLRPEPPVIPVSIRYESINTQSVNENNRDLICYYGEMTFFPHLTTLLTTKEVRVGLEILDPVRGQLENRKEIAGIAYERIHHVFKKAKTDSASSQFYRGSHVPRANTTRS